MNFLKDFWSAFWLFVAHVLRTLDFRLILVLAVFFAVLAAVLVKRLT